MDGPGANRKLTRQYGEELDLIESKRQDLQLEQYELMQATYNTRHQVTSTSYGYCRTPSETWDYTWDVEQGTLTSATDPEGARVEIAYENGLPTVISQIVSKPVPGTYDTSLGYWPGGLVRAITDANGHAVNFAYDASGYLNEITPAVGPRVKLTHTVLGHVDSIEVVPEGETAGRTTHLTVDAMGRVLGALYPDGLNEEFSYDPFGRVLQHEDTAGRTSTFTYMPGGDLKSATRVLEGSPNQNVTVSLDYDQQMNLLTVTDPLGRKVETYVLDEADRVTRVTNYEAQTMIVTYGVGDYVDRLQRFDGSQVAYTYDGGGRLSRSAYPTLMNEYAYYANGHLMNAVNETGTIFSELDSANRVMRVTQPAPNGEVKYAYLPAGQVASIVSVAGTNVYEYDAAERLSVLSDLPGKTSSNRFVHTYDPTNGLAACVSNAVSGIKVSYGYDVMDRVTNIVWRKGEDELRRFAYRFDAAGMITEWVSTAGAAGWTNGYEYDSLYRLTGETRVEGAVTTTRRFGYDLAGNRTSEIVDGVETVYTLGTGNRLASWGVGSEMLYDPAGNVTRIVFDPSRRVDLAWNDRYEVSSLSTNGVECERYGYDALGRRVFGASRLEDGSFETEYFVQSGSHVVAEVDSTGGLKRAYTHGPGIDNWLSMTVYTGATVNTYFYLTDHLGTVNAIADATGAIVESYKYDAWGKVLEVRDSSGLPLATPHSPLGNRILWQGREYSWATGLYYFRARWYDPVTGRWLSNDPIGISGGLNQYVFCGNNPVNARDPLGLREDRESDEYRKDFWKNFGFDILDKVVGLTPRTMEVHDAETGETITEEIAMGAAPGPGPGLRLDRAAIQKAKELFKNQFKKKALREVDVSQQTQETLREIVETPNKQKVSRVIKALGELIDNIQSMRGD
mgnify:CR=1 FL=1